MDKKGDLVSILPQDTTEKLLCGSGVDIFEHSKISTADPQSNFSVVSCGSVYLPDALFIQIVEYMKKIRILSIP